MSRQQGLTLVELLVVLTLTAMVSAVLFQGYGFMVGSYQRIAKRQNVEYQRYLAEGWWRDSVAALVPYFEDPARFQGTSVSFSGATFAPLQSPAGVQTRIAWNLVSLPDGIGLDYIEAGGQTVRIVHWPAQRAMFQYLSENGEWLTTWDREIERQLPLAIRIDLEWGETAPTAITSVVPIRKSQEIPSTVVLYGRD